MAKKGSGAGGGRGGAGGTPPDGAAGPGFAVSLACLLVVRLLGASLAPIMDCDETFNYLEPVHYVTYGYGMQTWEYSPTYALRSYAFVEAYALPVRLAQGLGFDKAAIFFFLRSCLGALSAILEAMMVCTVARRLGSRTALLTLCFLLMCPGMFHSAVATLPSTLCMYAVLLGYTGWLRGSYGVCLLCGAFAVLLGMPPVALLFVPHGLAALHPSNMGLVRVVALAIFALLAFVVAPSVLDGQYYGSGRPVWAMGNHILYNVLGFGGGGAGADLYGVEPWTYYFKNMMLNFNLVFPLSLCCGPMLLLAALARLPWPRATAEKGEAAGRCGATELFFLLFVPFAATFALFTKLAHKEERFLTMVYPLVCLTGALSLDAIAEMLQRFLTVVRCGGIARRGAAAVLALAVLASAALSASRIAALHHYFGAPLHLYGRLFNDVAAGTVRPTGGLCLAKEWYRFPTSFFLPDAPGSDRKAVTPLLWLNSSFGGQLPQPFGPWPHGLWEVPKAMNDQNLREPSRYSSEGECGLLVDLELPNQQEAPPDPKIWKELYCEAFLDADASPFPWRSFWLPMGLSDRRNTFGRYCAWVRREDAPQVG